MTDKKGADGQGGLSLSIQNDSLAIGELIDRLVNDVDRAQGWLLAIFRVAQKHFGDDAYRVNSDEFAAWLDQQIESAKMRQGQR